MDKITSIMDIEEELRVSNAALKVISQGVVISGPDRLIISTNAAFANITQYSMDEILHINCKFLQGPLTNQDTVKVMHDTLQSGNEFIGEVLNYRKDGTPFWNELSITPIRGDKGEITHFVGITRDITDRKNLEEELTKQLKETTRLNKLMVDRELKMIELKKEIATLKGVAE